MTHEELERIVLQMRDDVISRQEFEDLFSELQERVRVLEEELHPEGMDANGGEPAFMTDDGLIEEGFNSEIAALNGRITELEESIQTHNHGELSDDEKAET